MKKLLTKDDALDRIEDVLGHGFGKIEVKIFRGKIADVFTTYHDKDGE